MSEIRVELAPDFKGESVVLLAMDGDGLDVFSAVVAQLLQAGRGVLQLEHAGVTHVFNIEDGADFEFTEKHVDWRFSSPKFTEVLEKLDAMKDSSGPCHHYVDISGPVETLVLSRDEYV